MRLIDTHCHLNFKAFDADFLSLAAKSKNLGVEKVIIVGSDSDSSQKALEIARQINKKLKTNWAYVAVGIHPIHFDDGNNFNAIEKLMKDELIVAIGETGFDLYRIDQKSVPKQKELFYKHIELARNSDKPLIFHNRQADEIFNQEMPKLKRVRGVFHCFSADHNFAKKVIDLGFMISFTGNITYGNKKLKKVIKKTPIEKIMVETDAPYIVPEPQRSEGVKRNEPYLASEVIKKIAKKKGLEVSFVADCTTQNAIKFFGL